MMDESKNDDGEMFNLEQQLSADFGCSISGLRQVEIGTDSRVYAAKVDAQDVFFKVNDEETLFPALVNLFRLLSDRGIPVPHVIDLREHTTLGKPVLIEAAMYGTPIDKIDPSKRVEMMHQAGALLRRIHEVKFPGYGWLQKEDDSLRGDQLSWGEYLANGKMNVIRYLLENRLIDEDEQRALINFWDELSTTSFSEGSLLHGDFQAAHLFVDESNIVGVIDWGGSRVGDPQYDLAVSSMFIEGDEWSKFKEGYGALAEDPFIKRYGVMVAARKLQFRHQRGSKLESVVKAQERLKTGLHEVF